MTWGWLPDRHPMFHVTIHFTRYSLLYRGRVAGHPSTTQPNCIFINPLLPQLSFSVTHLRPVEILKNITATMASDAAAQVTVGALR